MLCHKCHDLAKRLSYYLYFFSWTYRLQGGAWESITWLCYNITMVWWMVTTQVTVSVCHMTRVTWGPWESKHIATVVKCISSREMSKNSIPYSEHYPPRILLNLILTLSTLSRWSPRSVTTSIHSQALGLRGLCSQLGTAGGSVIPSLGIATETWPRNQAVFSKILVFSWYKPRAALYCELIHAEDWQLPLVGRLD